MKFLVLFLKSILDIKRHKIQIRAQSSNPFSTLLLVIFLCLVGIHCQPSESEPNPNQVPYFSGKDFDPIWTDHPEKNTNLKQVPNSLGLIEHTGKQIYPKDWAPKESLVVFFYATCRGICPLITRNILQIQPQLSEFPDLKILSLSINSKADTVPVLQKYMESYKIQNQNWSFYTGKESEIETFAKGTCGAEMEGFSVERGKYEFVHTENIFLFDKNQYLRGIYRAKGTGDIQRLVEDIRKLRKQIN
ncbi:SCO family protein [Leptospira perdikensis]|uniref:SCO family protein n=1 Tax=Leptospira perdikensis TaxID=2484948 RepID=A0A4R9JI27_9LEPT|nr:SCO family protein [Leptospira perdikensis]TGL40301.1 SCO family protein [Leptospira perdikensis]